MGGFHRVNPVMRRFLSSCFGLAILAGPAIAPAHPVVLISIDGLRPDDVLHARERGLQLPNLSASSARAATPAASSG